MPQKIDIHGLFIDPESITDLSLQKRISVYCPVFYEIAYTKTMFQRPGASRIHILHFDHQQSYGIILSEAEQPDPLCYAVSYQEAAIEKMRRGLEKVGKNVTGLITELMKIDTSGNRELRILQPGRNIKRTSIREIPAKVRLLSGQWVDVFKSSPDYDFQGGSPYAVTDVDALALMIATKNKSYVLFGAGVDASNEDIRSAYHSLVGVYNEIQERRETNKKEYSKKALIQMPSVSLKLPRVSFPKIELPQVKFQSPLVLDKKGNKVENRVAAETDTVCADNNDH